MKVLATTSFAVDPSTDQAVVDELRRSVASALDRFESDHDLVIETRVAPPRPTGGDELVVELEIVFSSDSYAEVDRAMLQLGPYIDSELAADPGSPHVDSRETQLVPA